LEEKSKEDPAFAMAVVTAIQTQEPKFDALTATKSLRTLLGLFSIDAAKEYIRKSIDHFYEATEKLVTADGSVWLSLWPSFLPFCLRLFSNYSEVQEGMDVEPKISAQDAEKEADGEEDGAGSDDEQEVDVLSPFSDPILIAKGEINRLRYHRRTFVVNQIFSIARGYGPVFRDPDIQKACVKFLFFHAFYQFDPTAEDDGLKDSEIAPVRIPAVAQNFESFVFDGFYVSFGWHSLIKIITISDALRNIFFFKFSLPLPLWLSVVNSTRRLCRLPWRREFVNYAETEPLDYCPLTQSMRRTESSPISNVKPSLNKTKPPLPLVRRLDHCQRREYWRSQTLKEN